MVEIRLYQKEGTYKGSNETVKVHTEPFNGSESFEKSVYQIDYVNTYESWFWWYNKYYLNVYIHFKEGQKPIFTYYVSTPIHIIHQVEVYYSKFHKNVPLVVGLKRKDGIRYFEYLHLKNKGSHTGVPDQEFFEDTLEKRLDQENKKRNSLTFRISGSSRNLKKENEPYNNFVKHKYSVDEDNLEGPYEFCTDKLTSHGMSTDSSYSPLKSLDGMQFEFINLIYTDQGEMALLVEFIEHTSENKPVKHYFKRTSKGGTWEKIEIEGKELDKEREQIIVEYANYYVNNSIVIYINENGNKNEYSVKLAENSKSTLSYIEKSIKIQVTKPTDCLDDLKYTCYCHDLSKCNGTEAKIITGLRLFITGQDNTPRTDIELKLYDDKGSDRQYLYYNGYKSISEKYDKLYVYFNNEDNVPLLVNYGEKWYAPTNKHDYFNTWVFVTKLKGTEARKQRESQSGPKIVSELKKINKALNTLLLECKNNYGLSHTNTLKNFKLERVNVNKETVNESYHKITHKTVKSILGDVTYSGKSVVEQGGKSLNLADGYYQVALYYHLSDTDCNIPLLIRFIKVSNSIPDSFYERTSKNDNNTFKKIQFSQSQPLQDEKGLTNKINDIHYNFNKSIIIQLEKQNNSNYTVFLVENSGPKRTVSEPTTDSTISVLEETNCVPGSEYICYKHTINLGSSTKPVAIGGLRLYISTMEIMVYSDTNEPTIPIYYHDSKRDLYVYFYKGSSNKAKGLPLIVCYCNRYYGPSSLGQYFDKWQKLTSDSVQQQLKTHLDNINKELNQINISQTKHGSNYGISKPSHSLPDIDSEFYHRVNIKRCKNDYHRMVTHSTINNFNIGNVVYNGKQIKSTETLNNCNQVCVYYSTEDNYYSKPLLISIGSQDSSCPKKWYQRSSMDGTTWAENFESSRYDNSSKIQNEINKTKSELFKDLNVKIDQQKPYNVIINSKGKKHESLITIDKLITHNDYKARDYRCFEHQLSDYYEKANDDIKNQLSIEDDLTLELLIKISDIKIILKDKNGLSIDTLQYGSKEATMRTNLYVYFYEEDDNYIDSTDTVPMMIIYQHRFFGPESKDTYFKHWKELKINISDDDIKDKIRQNLNDINYNLNEIDPSKKRNYGISYCPKQGHVPEGFILERIKVSKFKNNNYNMYVHTTVNKCKIGKIKPIYKHNFEDHVLPLKNNDIIEVVLIFRFGYINYPKLMLLNEQSRFRVSSTLGYYHYQNNRGSPTKYVFKEIEYGLELMSLIKEGSQDYDSAFLNGIENIKPLLKEICNGPMMYEQSQQQSVVEDEDCKKQAGSETEMFKCPVLESNKPVSEFSNDLLSSPGPSQPPSRIPSVFPSREPEIRGGHTYQASSSAELPSEILEDRIDSVELSHGSLPDQEFSNGVTSELGQYDLNSHGQGAKSGSPDGSEVVSGIKAGEDDSNDQDLSQAGLVNRASKPEEKAVYFVDKSESASDQERNQKSQEEEFSRTTENSGRGPDLVGGQDEPRNNRLEETASRRAKHEVQEKGVSGSDRNKTSGDIGQQIMDIFEKNPEAVYGGGGTVLTAGISTYPLYKGISKLISK